MDIEAFYAADDRRRQSAEIELGTEWRDSTGVRFELSWIQDTHELYVMREPAPPEWEDPFGGIHVRTGPNASVDAMTVFVIAEIDDHKQLDTVLDGWESAMGEADSISWLTARIKEKGVGLQPLPDAPQ